MKFNKKSVSILFILLLLISLTACSNQSNELLNDNSTGELKLNFSLPMYEGMSLQSVTSQLDITEIKVTLTPLDENNNKITSEAITKQIDPSTTLANFSDLKAGNWDISIEAIDSNSNVVLKGNTITEIRMNDTTTTKIKMKFMPSDVVINVSNNSSNDIANIDFQLQHSELNNSEVKNIALENNTATVNFNEVKANSWQLVATFYDSNGNEITSLNWEDAILVLPGRTINFDFEITDGSININTDWPRAPRAPRNVSTRQNEQGVQLSWSKNENAATYSVYRSDTEDGPKELIASDITNDYYVDKNVTEGNTYWYFLKSYNSNGIPGDFSYGERLELLTTADKFTILDDLLAGIVEEDTTLFTNNSTLNSDGFTIYYPDEVISYYDFEVLLNGNADKAGLYEKTNSQNILTMNYADEWEIYGVYDNVFELGIELSFDFVDTNGNTVSANNHATFHYKNINGEWKIQGIEIR